MQEVTRKNDWQPIPSLGGKYEMNLRGEVRNAETKRVLKPNPKRKKVTAYQLKFNGKTLYKTKEVLLAETFGNGYFSPIPSLDYMYEINPHGKIRNAKTKRLVKMFTRGNYDFSRLNIKGKNYTGSVKKLLWEVYGIIPEKIPRQPVGVTLQKDNFGRFFQNAATAAKFLSPLVYLSVHTVAQYFYKRRKELYGWQVIYHEPEQRIFRDMGELLAINEKPHTKK